MLPAAGPQCGFLKRKIFQGVDLMIREPKALHVEVRLAAVHDIGDGATCRACLRPARRTVSNIEEQVGSRGLAEDWRSPGTYRPKAGPVTRPASGKRTFDTDMPPRTPASAWDGPWPVAPALPPTLSVSPRLAKATRLSSSIMPTFGAPACPSMGVETVYPFTGQIGRLIPIGRSRIG